MLEMDLITELRRIRRETKFKEEFKRLKIKYCLGELEVYDYIGKVERLYKKYKIPKDYLN